MDAGGLVGFEHEPAADRDDRIEDRPCRARERRMVHRDRICDGATTTDERRARGLVAGLPVRGAVHRHHVHHPRRALGAGPRATRAQDALVRRHELGLDEQVRERRVRCIGARLGQHHLGVARQLDRAPGAAAVGQRDAAELDVVLGRDRDLHVRLDLVIRAAELRAPLREDRLVAATARERGLMRDRPHGAGIAVAHVAERAPGIARRILAPARHREVAPATVSAARVRDGDVVVAVRQKMHLGRGRVRRGEHAKVAIDLERPVRCERNLGRMREDRRQARDAFLKQQLRRLERRRRHEPLLHRAIEQHVRDREERHALVVGHVRRDRRRGLARREA